MTAWIEISLVLWQSLLHMVAVFMTAWIEIIYVRKKKKPSTVAVFMTAWIEIAALNAYALNDPRLQSS